MRAAAVLSVIALHAALPGELGHGGFLGVDVFFVLSGFLNTTILVGERDQVGRIRLARFYGRRALRLLPALFLVLSVMVVVATLANPGWGPGTLPGIPFVALYAANWAQVLGVGLGALGHTWSLAIEEQFYLLWPITLGVMLTARRPRGRLALWLVLAALAVCVERALLDIGGASDVRLYVGLDTRADALLLGSALAVWRSTGWRPRSERAIWILRGGAAGAGALLAVLIVLLRFPSTFLFRGGFTLVAAASAVLIWQLVDAPWRPTARLLESGPAVMIGRISYGLYLWHIPVFATFPLHAFAGRAIVVGHVLRLALLFAIALASYHWIERPALRLKQRLSAGAEGVPADLVPPHRSRSRAPGATR